jgi:hypothetical protein
LIKPVDEINTITLKKPWKGFLSTIISEKINMKKQIMTPASALGNLMASSLNPECGTTPHHTPNYERRFSVGHLCIFKL